ncbi:nucleotide disphospho-sugar-binding domain-containing protein [Streptomyces sp. L2]|uniref:nucleotide disphospho-sugar-binding domain-containing protein n=1 Tax=Streptomyces sp. L2 TaxID=2162665 RepID=UPI0010104829|nr:nucleotide disphospho-sugar-binding domain-containing protein [Streptomyces sp. L2]
MRVVMTSCPQYGHFFPLVPLGWALQAGGHEVRVAVPEQFTGAVAGSGLPAVAVGGIVRTRDIMGVGDRKLLADWLSDPRGMHINAIRTVSRFANFLTEPIVDLCRAWRPDLIVHLTLEFAGPLAARVTGIPAVSLSPGPVLPQEAFDAVDQELADLYERWGPPGQPALQLDLWPPSLQAAHAPSSQAIRHIPYSGPGTVPTWLRRPSAGPRVGITLGSVIPQTGGTDALSVVLSALEELGHDAVIVLPDEQARAAADGAYGRLPPNAMVATVTSGPWLPFSYVAPTCDVVIHHGGAGTTLTCLAGGLPQLILPYMADQFTIAEQLARQGTAIALPPGTATKKHIAEELARLLTHPSHIKAAQRLRKEIQRQPSPSHIVERLMELTG